MTIDQSQKEIIQEFAALREYGEDMYKEVTNEYLTELGKKLPHFDAAKRIETNEVKGCMSKVWMVASEQDGKIFFEVDSNTVITKGLLSLLARVLSGQTPDAILSSDLNFPAKIGMERFIGTQRTNGFAAMIKQMKLYALAFKTRAEVKS